MTLYKATLTKKPQNGPDRDVYVHIVSENMWDARDKILEHIEGNSEVHFKLIEPIAMEGDKFIIDTGLRSDLARK